MTDVATFVARTAAKRILDEIASNGGTLKRQADQGDGLVRVLIDYAPNADRPRCRDLVAQAKADGTTWAAVLHLLQCEGGAA